MPSSGHLSTAAIALALAASFGAAGGCAASQPPRHRAPSQLATLSSGEVGCAPDTIRIEEENARSIHRPRAWVAICEGRRHRCTAIRDLEVLGALREASCALEPTSAAMVGFEFAGGEPRITRTITDDHAVFTARLPLETASIAWVTSPTRQPESAYVTIGLEGDAPHGECPAGVLVDGVAELFSIHGVVASRGGERVTYVSTMSTLRRAAVAEHVSVRVCSFEIILGSEHVETLRELVRRSDEELAWHAAQATPGEPGTTETTAPVPTDSNPY